jgi:putative FmdB family regulatory protein
LPLYEYECEACRHRFEALQKFADPPLETCPKCGGRLRKLQAAPAFQFKGSGWYVTDYAKKDSGGEKSDGGKDSKPAASEATKGDSSKPATDAASSSSTSSGTSGGTTTPSGKD